MPPKGSQGKSTLIEPLLHQTVSNQMVLQASLRHSSSSIPPHNTSRDYKTRSMNSVLIRQHSPKSGEISPISSNENYNDYPLTRKRKAIEPLDLPKRSSSQQRKPPPSHDPNTIMNDLSQQTVIMPSTDDLTTPQDDQQHTMSTIKREDTTYQASGEHTQSASTYSNHQPGLPCESPAGHHETNGYEDVEEVHAPRSSLSTSTPTRADGEQFHHEIDQHYHDISLKSDLDGSDPSASTSIRDHNTNDNTNDNDHNDDNDNVTISIDTSSMNTPLENEREEWLAVVRYALLKILSLSTNTTAQDQQQQQSSSQSNPSQSIHESKLLQSLFHEVLCLHSHAHEAGTGATTMEEASRHHTTPISDKSPPAHSQQQQQHETMSSAIRDTTYACLQQALVERIQADKSCPSHKTHDSFDNRMSTKTEQETPPSSRSGSSHPPQDIPSGTTTGAATCRNHLQATSKQESSTVPIHLPTRLRAMEQEYHIFQLFLQLYQEYFDHSHPLLRHYTTQGPPALQLNPSPPVSTANSGDSVPSPTTTVSSAISSTTTSGTTPSQSIPKLFSTRFEEDARQVAKKLISTFLPLKPSSTLIKSSSCTTSSMTTTAGPSINMNMVTNQQPMVASPPLVSFHDLPQTKSLMLPNQGQGQGQRFPQSTAGTTMGMGIGTVGLPPATTAAGGAGVGGGDGGSGGHASVGNGGAMSLPQTAVGSLLRNYTPTPSHGPFKQQFPQSSQISTIMTAMSSMPSTIPSSGQVGSTSSLVPSAIPAILQQQQPQHQQVTTSLSSLAPMLHQQLPMSTTVGGTGTGTMVTRVPPLLSAHHHHLQHQGAPMQLSSLGISGSAGTAAGGMGVSTINGPHSAILRQIAGTNGIMSGININSSSAATTTAATAGGKLPVGGVDGMNNTSMLSLQKIPQISGIQQQLQPRHMLHNTTGTVAQATYQPASLAASLPAIGRPAAAAAMASGGGYFAHHPVPRQPAQHDGVTMDIQQQQQQQQQPGMLANQTMTSLNDYTTIYHQQQQQHKHQHHGHHHQMSIQQNSMASFPPVSQTLGGPSSVDQGHHHHSQQHHHYQHTGGHPFQQQQQQPHSHSQQPPHHMYQPGGATAPQYGGGGGGGGGDSQYYPHHHPAYTSAPAAHYKDHHHAIPHVNGNPPPSHLSSAYQQQLQQAPQQPNLRSRRSPPSSLNERQPQGRSATATGVTPYKGQHDIYGGGSYGTRMTDGVTTRGSVIVEDIHSVVEPADVDDFPYPPELVNPLVVLSPYPDTIYVTPPFPLNGNIQPLSLQDYINCYPDIETAESTYNNHSKRMTLDNPHGFVQSAIIELRGIVDFRVHCRAVRRKLSQRHYKNVCSCPDRTALMNSLLNRPYYPPSVKIQQILDIADDTDELEALP